jgi:hypothetical protein
MNDQTLNLWRQIEQSRRRGKRRLMPSPLASTKAGGRA